MLRSAVGQQLAMRHTPTLTFVLDATADEARHLDDLLARVHASDEAAAAAREGKSFAGDAAPYKNTGE